MEPISTGAYLGAMGISALGSALGGYSQAQAAKDAAKRQQQQAQQVLGQSYQQMGQNDRQFAQNSNLDRSKYLDQRALGAADIQRRINLTPIADQAAYGMRNMLGAAPAPFQPRDFTRGTMPGQGQASGGAAPMLAAQNAAMQQYTPGAGGMDNPELAATRERLKSMVGVPAEYAAMNPNQMRLGAEMQQMQIDAANAKKARDRVAIQDRMNRLQGSLGGGGTAPNVLQQASGRFGGDRAFVERQNQFSPVTQAAMERLRQRIMGA